MANDVGTEEPQLLEYVHVLRRRKWWLAAGVALGIAGAAAFVYTSPKEYTATSTLLVSGVPTVDVSVTPGTVSTQQLDTYAQMFGTGQIMKGAARVMGQTPYPAKATVSASSSFIYVSATGPSATLAARSANAYAQAFIKNRTVTAAADGQVAVRSIATQISSISSQISHLQKQARHASATAAAAIQGEISSLQTEATGLAQERTQAVISAQLATGGVSVANRAGVPGIPSSPKPKRDLLFGGIAGLVLGLGAALGIDAIDDRIGSREDLERSFPHLPLLGYVPFIDSWKAPNQPYVVSLEAPRSPAAEAFRSVRTALQFVRVDKDLHTVLVTGSNPGEGKSATVANLGIGLAKAGQQVCVVSADLRRPRLGKFLGLSDEVGITTVAVGEASLDQALQSLPDVPGLSYLGTGTLPAEASEFLGSHTTAEIFRELRQRFDMVLIDSPPMLAVADPLVMTSYADGVAVVVQIGRTRRRNLSRVRELLQQGDAEVIGAIVSEVTAGTFERYGTYGGYGGYGSYGRYGRYGTYGTYSAEEQKKGLLTRVSRARTPRPFQPVQRADSAFRALPD